MRTALAFLAFLTVPALAAEMPEQACSAQFVKRWRSDKVVMVETPGAMPEKPCLMRTGKGDYVCNKTGCVSGYAYTGDN